MGGRRRCEGVPLLGELFDPRFDGAILFLDTSRIKAVAFFSSFFFLSPFYLFTNHASFRSRHASFRHKGGVVVLVVLSSSLVPATYLDRWISSVSLSLSLSFSPRKAHRR